MAGLPIIMSIHADQGSVSVTGSPLARQCSETRPTTSKPDKFCLCLHFNILQLNFFLISLDFSSQRNMCAVKSGKARGKYLLGESLGNCFEMSVKIRKFSLI